MGGNKDARARKQLLFGSDLLRLSLRPGVLPLFTYEDRVLGSVHQHVKRHEAHDAGQTETARVNLHTNLRSDGCHTNTHRVTVNKTTTTKPALVTNKSHFKFDPKYLTL